MEYTNQEKQILDLIQRTDFRNLSKNDLISYASKLNELRPEVATQVIAQYPELVNSINSALLTHKETLEAVIKSDDSSLNQVYQIINKGMDATESSRAEFNNLAEKVLSDCSKCLDNPNMSPEQQNEILERESEILRMVDKKDTEIRAQEREAVQTVENKDSEKRMFNWKVIATASALVVIATGISAAALGGKINIKLPTKYN